MKAPETSPEIDITHRKQTEELTSTKVRAGMKERTDAGTEGHGKKKRRTYRLQTQLSICFIALLILTSAILTSVLYLNFQERIREDTRDRLRDEVSIAALQIDGDAHNNLTGPEDEGNSNYLQLRSTLQHIRDAGSDIYYIYTMRLDDNESIMFLVDAETNPDEIAHLGDIYDDASEMLNDRFASLDRPIVEKDFYTDKWGTWLTAYAPFYTSDGQRAGVVGMDIKADEVKEQEEHFLRLAITIFITTIPIAVAAGWFVGRKLAAPIVSLTKDTKRISDGHLDSRVPEHNIEELNDLATAFNTMTGKLGRSLEGLRDEMRVREKAEKELKKHREHLEEIVEARTEELADANVRLKEADTMKNEFIFILAHDLGTPIAIMKGNIELMKKGFFGETSEKQSKKLDVMLRGAMHLDKLRQDTLDLSLMAEGALELERKSVMLGDLIAEGVEDIRRLAHEKKQEVVMELPKLDVVECDPMKIRQALDNYLSNAVRYTGEDGRITVGAAQSEDHVTVWVRDTGRGLPPGELEKVFGRFYRTGERVSGSTGLGLAIVKGIVEAHWQHVDAESRLGQSPDKAHGGRAWCESEGEGKGATFYFMLPSKHVSQ